MKLKLLFNLLNLVTGGLFNFKTFEIRSMRFISFIFLISISTGQWTSFELDDLSDYSKDSESLYRTAGLSATHNFNIPINGDNRITYGGSLLKGISTNGILPILHSQIKVSWNMTLRGRMAEYSAKEGAIQMFGWGASLRLGKENEPSKWIINFDSGYLNSHDVVKVSSLQAMAVREIVLNNFPIYFGLGFNILKAVPYESEGIRYQGNKEIQTNLILIGTVISVLEFKVIPQIWFGPEFSMILLNLAGTF